MNQTNLQMLHRLANGDEMTIEDAKTLFAVAEKLGITQRFDEAVVKLAERSVLVDARNRERSTRCAIGKRREREDREEEVLGVAESLLSKSEYKNKSRLADDIEKALDGAYLPKTIIRYLNNSDLLDKYFPKTDKS